MRGLFFAAILTFGVITPSAPAHAVSSPVQCSPTEVGYSSAGYAVFVCGGNNYLVWLSGAPSGCGNATMDIIKLWMSEAQAALLSGKNLNIYFSVCSGSNGAYQVDIQQ
jgi:hypothetical protein